MKSFYTYILASQKNGTLYIGVTSDLSRRTLEHKLKILPGFTTKYNVMSLVYYEEFKIPMDAIQREKQLKKWNREWKLNLIEKINPKWKDLYNEEITEEDFIEPGSPPSRGRQ